jgi:hypothetical protein
MFWRPTVALILNRREGDDLFVCDAAGDQQLIVERVLDDRHFVIRMGEVLYDVTYEQTVEVLPNVRLLSGRKK